LPSVHLDPHTVRLLRIEPALIMIRWNFPASSILQLHRTSTGFESGIKVAKQVFELLNPK